MSYEATGSGTITLNVASATEQRNLQMALLTWYDNCCAAELNLCGDSMKFQIERAYQASKQKMLRYLAVLDQKHGAFSALWGNNPENDLATPHIERDQAKEDIIFEKLDQWIWSLRHDKPPTMGDIKPQLAMDALARIYGASQKGLPTIEFPMKFEPQLRRIAALQEKNAELRGIIKKNEEAIEAHSVRIAELMKQHEHGILTTTTDKLLVDYVTNTTRRVSSEYLKQNYPAIYEEARKPSGTRKVKVTIQPL